MLNVKTEMTFSLVSLFQLFIPSALAYRLRNLDPQGVAVNIPYPIGHIGISP
jgi:hypothetical protein